MSVTDPARLAEPVGVETNASSAAGCRENVERFPSPYAFLRLGGLPFSELVGLRCNATAISLASLLDVERALSGRKEPLTDALHAALPRLADSESRRLLLDVKRAVFNGRPPKGGAGALRRLGKLLPRELRLDLVLWYRLLLQKKRRDEALPEIFTRELRERRISLRALAAREDFQKGLLLASVPFFDVVRRYLGSAGPFGAEEEHVETSTMLYLCRMAAKTSPFGTFGPTALGRFHREPRPAIGAALPKATRSRTRLNTSLAHLLARHVARLPAVRDGLEVTARPLASSGGDALVVLRSQYVLDPVFARKESVVRIPHMPSVRGVLDFVASQRNLTYRALVDRLAGGETSPLQAAVAAVERLIATGLLDCRLPLGPHDVDPLATLVAFVRTRAGSSSDASSSLLTVADALERLARAVPAYRDARPPERRRIHEEMRERLDALGVLLSIPCAEIKALDAIREDEGIPGISWGAGPTLFDALAQDLLPMLEAFRLGWAQDSPALLSRFVATYGAGGTCPDALAFLVRFADELQDRMARGESPEETIPVLCHSDRLLRDLNRDALKRWAEAGESGPVALDPAILPAGMPDLHGRPASVTVFFQIAARDTEAFERGEYLLVLNGTQTGLGAYAARFAAVYGEGDGDAGDPLVLMLREHFANLCPNAELVDLPLLTDSSDVQVHPRLLPRDLAWPGEPADRDALSFDALELAHDREVNALRVREKSTGRQVLPLYLGGLYPLLLRQPLPTVINTLTAVGYPYARDFWRETENPATAVTPPGATVPSVGLRRLPRVTLGRLVLARAAWSVPSEDVPRPLRAESNAAYFLRVMRWKQEIGLPDVVFAKADVYSMSGIFQRKHKPFLVDFRNPWCVWSIPRMLVPEAQRITFTEMLPGQSDLFATRGGEPVVSELQVEITWRETTIGARDRDGRSERSFRCT